MKKLTIRDIDLQGKRVLMRVDFNVPLDPKKHVIADDMRIKAVLPTIRYVLEEKACLVLMSHLGRPADRPDPDLSLKPVAGRLEKLLGVAVDFAADCIGAETEAMAKNLLPGRCLLLENLRFHPEEKKNDDHFSRSLARLGDVYVNDAFGTSHRVHASVVGVTRYFSLRAAGFLMEKELDMLGAVIESPEKPFVALLGGAKVADKVTLMYNILPRLDSVLIGGGMAFSFLKARGVNTGKSILDSEHMDEFRKWLNEYPEKFVLPVDCLAAEKLDLDSGNLGRTRIVSVNEIPDDWMGVDIGPRTVELFSTMCQGVKTMFWNGPMGVFEIDEAARGTMEMAKLMARLNREGAKTVIGGGDSALAVKKAGLTDQVTHVSTGGGASLEFLEGKELPGVAALSEAEG